MKVYQIITFLYGISFSGYLSAESALCVSEDSAIVGVDTCCKAQNIYTHHLEQSVTYSTHRKRKIPSVYEWLVKHDKSFRRVYHSYSFPTEIARLYNSDIDMDVTLHERKNQIEHYIDDYGVAWKGRPVVWVLDSVFLRVSNAPAAAVLYYRKYPLCVSTNQKENRQQWLAEMIKRDYDGVEAFKTVTIHTNDDSWKKYLDMPLLEKYHPVTVFLDSKFPQDPGEILIEIDRK